MNGRGVRAETGLLESIVATGSGTALVMANAVLEKNGLVTASAGKQHRQQTQNRSKDTEFLSAAVSFLSALLVSAINIFHVTKL